VAEEDALRAEHRALDREMLRTREYQRLATSLGASLADGRCTLAEAVAGLGRSARAQDPAWLARLRQSYGCRSDRECLAAGLIRRAVASRGHCPRLAGQVAGRLGDAFRAEYGRLPPEELVSQPHEPRAGPGGGVADLRPPCAGGGTRHPSPGPERKAP